MSFKMSHQFPLYTTLNAHIPTKDLTIAQKHDFIRKVASMDSEAHDLIFALIKCYFLEHNSTDTFSIPYNGQLAKDRIDFNLMELPNQLRQLLYRFVTIHGKKLAEDKRIQEMQTTQE